MTRYCLALLALIGSLPASADLVRINLRVPIRAPLSGFIVYDSDTAPTGTVPTTRFDGAVREFEFGGVKGINNTILVTGDSIEFRSENGLRVVFGGSTSLTPGVLPDVLPNDWTSRSWESDQPFFGDRGGDFFHVSYSDPDPENTAVLFVGNEGSDSDACGYEWQRCRSISQAIRNAHDGDTILVGPGIYGDVNGDGGISSNDPGEEQSPLCFCLVYIDKRLTILSEQGASATIIDAGNSPFTIVHIFASRAVFGFSGYGFTVLGQRDPGISGLAPISFGALVESEATIWGNRFLDNWRDFGISAQRGAQVAHVYDNEVSGFSAGVVVQTGRVVGNSIHDNGSGITTLRAAVENNVIEANRGDGVWFQGPTGASHLVYVTGNDIIRNSGRGIRLEDSSNNPFDGLDASVFAIQDNNLVGNDRDAQGDNMACGVYNDAGGLVWAPYNHWGSPDDPDRACDAPGSLTITDPMRLEPHSR